MIRALRSVGGQAALGGEGMQQYFPPHFPAKSGTKVHATGTQCVAWCHASASCTAACEGRPDVIMYVMHPCAIQSAPLSRSAAGCRQSAISDPLLTTCARHLPSSGIKWHDPCYSCNNMMCVRCTTTAVRRDKPQQLRLDTATKAKDIRRMVK